MIVRASVPELPETAKMATGLPVRMRNKIINKNGFDGGFFLELGRRDR
jgi:hypothetical protein